MGSLDQQPSDAEVEILFARVLLALLLPESVCEQLEQTESIAGKWKMIKMNATLLATSAVSTSFAKSDDRLLSEVRTGAIGPLTELRKRLSSSSRGWLNGFYQNRGIETLVDVLEQCSSEETYTELKGYALLQTFHCVKAVMNHRAGLEHVSASNCGLLEAVATAALKEPSGGPIGAAVATLGLELLGVAAHFFSKEVNVDLEALSRACGSPNTPVPRAVVAAALSLANELICAQDDVTRRCALRSSLLDIFKLDERHFEQNEARLWKRDAVRAMGEREGELLALKSNHLKTMMMASLGVPKTKVRIFTLREARLSWVREDEVAAKQKTRFLGGRRKTPTTIPPTSPEQHKDHEDDPEAHSIELTSDVAAVCLGADNGAFVFEVQSPSKSLVLTESTSSGRTRWLAALRRAVSRVHLAGVLAEHNEAEHVGGGSLWERVTRPFDFVLDASNEVAVAVIKAQTAAFWKIAESDRLESLATLGVDLNDVGSILRKLKDEALRRHKTRHIIDIAGRVLGALASGELPHFDVADETALAISETPPPPVRRPVSHPATTTRAKAPPMPKKPPPSGGPAMLPTLVEEEKERSSSISSVSSDESKYEAMLKNGVPRAAVEVQMQTDGLDPKTLPSRAQCEEKQHGVEESKSSPPPPPAEPAVDIVKFLNMLKVGMPRQAVEFKMQAEGVDPTLLGGRPPLPVASSAPKENNKYGEDPRVPMRALFWTALRGDRAGTVWRELKEEQEDFDITALENSFGKVEKAPKQLPPDYDALFRTTITTTEKHKGVEVANPGQTTTRTTTTALRLKIDGKTLQNVGIVLAKLQRQVPMIASTVFAGDYEIIDGQCAAMLLGACPSAEILAEAEELLARGEENTSNLNEVERFFCDCARVPDYAARLDALNLLSRAEDQLRELAGQLAHVGTAVDRATTDPTLRQALSAALKLGNYVNGGTSRGMAVGFRLEGLKSFALTKGKDGATYADHLATVLRGDDTMEEKLESLRESFSTAALVNLVQWDQEAAAFQVQLLQVERLVDDDATYATNLERQAFSSGFQPFVLDARSQLESLRATRIDVRRGLKTVAVAFDGPAAEPAPPSELFGEQLGDFVAAMIRSLKTLAKRFAQDDAKKLAYVPMKRASQKQLPAAQMNDDLFHAYAEMQMDEANVVNAFHNRHNDATITRAIEL